MLRSAVHVHRALMVLLGSPSSCRLLVIFGKAVRVTSQEDESLRSRRETAARPDRDSKLTSGNTIADSCGSSTFDYCVVNDQLRTTSVPFTLPENCTS